MWARAVTISEEDRQIATYRRDQTVKRIVKLSALGILAVAACLQHFVLTLPQPKAGLPTPTDGLVVPTGGQARIQEGLLLLHNLSRHGAYATVLYLPCTIPFSLFQLRLIARYNLFGYLKPLSA